MGELHCAALDLAFVDLTLHLGVVEARLSLLVVVDQAYNFLLLALEPDLVADFIDDQFVVLGCR